MASAATLPTAFQYWKGAPSRLEISFSASAPGQILEASA